MNVKDELSRPFSSSPFQVIVTNSKKQTEPIGTPTQSTKNPYESCIFPLVSLCVWQALQPFLTLISPFVQTSQLSTWQGQDKILYHTVVFFKPSGLVILNTFTHKYQSIYIYICVSPPIFCCQKALKITLLPYHASKSRQHKNNRCITSYS